MKKLFIILQIVFLTGILTACENGDLIGKTGNSTEEDGEVTTGIGNGGDGEDGSGSDAGGEEAGLSEDTGSFWDNLFSEDKYRKIHLTLNLAMDENGSEKSASSSGKIYNVHSTGNAEFDLIFNTKGGEALAQNGRAYYTSYTMDEAKCTFTIPEEYKGTPEKYDTTGIPVTLQTASLDTAKNVLTIKGIEYQEVSMHINMSCGGFGNVANMDIKDGFTRLFDRINKQVYGGATEQDAFNDQMGLAPYYYDFVFESGYGAVTNGEIPQTSCYYQEGTNSYFCSGAYTITDFGDDYDEATLKGMGELD